MFMLVKAINGGSLALRVLLVLAAFALLYGCTQASSPPERQEKHRGVEQAETEQAKEPKQEIEKEQTHAAGVESTPSASSRETAGVSGPLVKITRVVDGDTIEISPKVDGKDTVNLIGIDAPEEEIASCGAQPLAQVATDRIADEKGTKVKLEFGKKRTDQNGRLLAYVHAPFLAVGSYYMLNEQMVRGGLAQVHIVPPNTKYEDRLRNAQQEAKEEAKKHPNGYPPNIWTLTSDKQARLADHYNGIGQGDGACPPK